jgi:predicted DNA-binding antitoxin AbrB/MazE fold protein
MEVNVMEVYENGVLKRLFELQIDEIPKCGNLQV